MIMTYAKHGRSPRDSGNLIAHLLKPENTIIKILAIGGSVATDLCGVIADMELLRDGSSAKSAFHHLSFSPSINYTEEQLLFTAEALRAEFDPSGIRPWIALVHFKPRENSEQGDLHGHIVIGHVDGDGRALKDGRSRIRSEVIARTMEYNFNENPVRSRHQKTVCKILRDRNLDAVADRIVAAFGADPQLPESAYGSKSRQAAERIGLKLPVAKGAIANAWISTQELGAFQNALDKLGYCIQPGKKKNVWIVVDAAGRSIGALDRLLKLKRDLVQNLMEQTDESRRTRSFRSSADDGRSGKENLREIESSQSADRSTTAITGAFADSGTGNGSGPRPTHLAVPTKFGSSRSTPGRAIADDQFQARSAARKFQYRRALTILSRVGLGLHQSGYLRNWSRTEVGTQLPMIWGLKSIWGIPIEPPKYRPP
jgi:hypothetical protein